LKPVNFWMFQPAIDNRTMAVARFCNAQFESKSLKS
jgi:hypothetical protein